MKCFTIVKEINWHKKKYYMSFVIWFSGLPCSGKSVLSKKLAQCVPNMEILDGDDKLINALRPNRSKESRIIHAERIAHLAKLLLK